MSERAESTAGLSWAVLRERARREWRAIHEAVHYASNATRCVQYTDFADLRARRGDIRGDLDALRCMQQNGQLVGDAARRYEQLHAEFTTLMRQDGDLGAETAIDGFVAALNALEEQLWALVPAEQLPVGMFTPVNIGTSDRIRLVRRKHRSGELAL
jgi:hypothetical protein